MYIKKLTIQGFKSYRDETVIDPFSPGLNVVVGRNGSAIRFVLSDAYTSLSRDQRQGLLHEGVSTTATFSAFVEIVFDNEDQRFPTGKDEVILRRTVGAKKDEYSLDRKSTTKAEVMNLLESAGFSRSNPYYIVPQGRITHLTNQKDPERLDLLKEVAGTKVYEDRRAESLKIIEETDARREKVDELLTYIEERLEELEEEKKELKEYTTKDRERRCLEYTIYQRNLQEAVDAFEAVEDERKESINNSNAARESYEARSRAIAAKESEQSDLQRKLDLLQLEKAQLLADRKDAGKAKTQIECIIRDLQESSNSMAHTRQTLQEELDTVEEQITVKQAELDDLVPRWDKSVDREKQLSTTIEDATARQAALLEKQGRSTQFSTQRERDAFLRAEIDKLDHLIPANETRIEEAETNIIRCKAALETASKKAEDLAAGLSGRKDILRNMTDDVGKLRESQSELSEKRKQLWKEESKLANTVKHARDELQGAERILYSAMDRNTANGLRAVTRIVAEHSIAGVYGPLYELFTVPDAYRQAAEVAAGNSLFHIVVKDDEVATRVLEIMQREKSGRVTFMPLNRLKPKPVNYPDASVRDVIPLIHKLRFVEDTRKAFEQTFSKILITDKLDEAGAAMRKYGLTVITMDGDRVDRKGALTGGFHDTRRSRLEAASKLKKWAEEWQKDSAREKEVKQEIARIDQAVTKTVGDLSIAERRLKETQEGRDPIVNELKGLRREEEQLHDRSARLENALFGMRNDLSGLKVQKDSYAEELSTPMTQTLTDDELETLTELSKKLEISKQDLAKASRATTKLASTKNILEIELNESLKRQRDDLRGKMESTSVGGGSSSAEDVISSRQGELRRLTANLDALATKMQAVDDDAESQTAAMQQIEKELDALQGQQAEDARGINKQQKGAERYHAKRQLLLQRRSECEGNIRDLGVVPEEAFDKYTETASDILVNKLHRINDALKKFSHVNKKAVEQYSSFTTQKEQLDTRREELEKSSSSMEELVETLDQRKDEAIERTFKQVSKYFAETFEKLVPAGRGRLIMQKRLDEVGETADPVDDLMEMDEDDDEEESEGLESEEDEDTGNRKSKRKQKGKGKAKPPPAKKQRKKKSAIDNYTGVAIEVSFNSKSDEGLRIQQLSGGQKSLVALTVVFAIQRCDPAPFYLFDEIDANLDADRRTAIASMIKELSEEGQFIITTFRPELLAHADNFFGVIFDARKISTIKDITQEDCYSFVQAQAS